MRRTRWRQPVTRGQEHVARGTWHVARFGRRAMRRVVGTGIVAMAAAATLSAENWPQWRGPAMNGVSAEKGLPLKWSPTENIAWKLAMPGRSGSTPIIWGERIFLNIGTADGGGDLELWALDRGDGTRPLEAATSPAATTSSASRTCRPLAGHRRPDGLGDDRRRRAQGVRLQRQGAVGARHPEGLRPVRPELGLRVVAAAARTARSTCRCFTA